MYKVLACLAALAVATPAGASTLKLKGLKLGHDALAAVDQSAGATLEANASFDAMVVTGSPAFAKSPYEINGVGSFEMLDYFAIADPANTTFPVSADLTFTKDRSKLTFLWGTPDLAPFTGPSPVTNTIELFADGTSLGTLDLSDMFPAYDFSSRDPVLTQIVSTVMFDQVRFTTTRNAFEIANITSSVPVPAGFVLMAGGLGLLGLRKRAAA